MKEKKFILWYRDISKKDVPLVGGKNASLGEMISQLEKKGINIPNGFALTSFAFWHFLKENKIDEKLKEIFKKLNPKDPKNLKKTGEKARNLILRSKFPKDLEKEILDFYQKLSQKYGKKEIEVAVRSSATAEDLPSASFAGQHETFLNVFGKENLLKAIKKCFASLFTDRAIAYREEKGFSHLKTALSVGVQKMVRSDLGASGVMFTLDTETGFRNVILINGIFGVGEMIVKGKIIPDEFCVFKPTLEKGYLSIIFKNLGKKTKKYVFKKTGGLKEVSLSKKERESFSLKDSEVITLAKWGILIEKHYGVPQDIEWAKDGIENKLYIVQARPETVYSQKSQTFFEEYQIKTKTPPILTGISVGNKISQGKARKIFSTSQFSLFKKGEILVTKMTDPDWLPVMRMASGIITDEGGRTCHAAIVARELGIPAVVGTQRATEILKNGDQITIDCSGKVGKVFLGKVPFEVRKIDLKELPKLKTKIMVNIGTPEIAFQNAFLPVEGVGLARIEFILAEKIKVHPLVLYHYEKLKKKAKRDKKIKQIINEVDKVTIEHKNKKEFFFKELAEGIAQIACAFWSKPVIVRFSDFKSNEYRKLIGGELFEPEEENPMLGWRGASRYYDPKYKNAFEMEIKAIKRARDIFGLKNIWVMVPFCRTLEEAKKVLKILKENGLERGKNGLKIICMCEIPSNVILAEKFLEFFDGFSIGSNDLTQLTLGLDRDSALVSKIGNENNLAVKEMIKKVIKICKEKKKYCGICGQAPSDFPEFAKFLVNQGIESISLNPDSIIKTILKLKD